VDLVVVVAAAAAAAAVIHQPDLRLMQRFNAIFIRGHH